MSVGSNPLKDRWFVAFYALVVIGFGILLYGVFSDTAPSWTVQGASLVASAGAVGIIARLRR